MRLIKLNPANLEQWMKQNKLEPLDPIDEVIEELKQQVGMS